MLAAPVVLAPVDGWSNWPRWPQLFIFIRVDSGGAPVACYLVFDAGRRVEERPRPHPAPLWAALPSGGW
jgi:hypothetical protein